jgi:hypothetical protein
LTCHMEMSPRDPVPRSSQTLEKEEHSMTSNLALTMACCHHTALVSPSACCIDQSQVQRQIGLPTACAVIALPRNNNANLKSKQRPFEIILHTSDLRLHPHTR